MHPGLNWELSKQTFAQKAALLSNLDLPEDHNALPAIKHMNSLRNKLSHRMNFKLQAEDLLPFIHLLQKGRDATHPLPAEPRKVLEEFTSRVCAFFGGVVFATAHHMKMTRDEA